MSMTEKEFSLILKLAFVAISYGPGRWYCGYMGKCNRGNTRSTAKPSSSLRSRLLTENNIALQQSQLKLGPFFEFNAKSYIAA